MLQLAQSTPLPAQPACSEWELPPLILHPISHSSQQLPEAAHDGETARLEARRLELRMLCCLGKDLTRWLEQCLEFASADPGMAAITEGRLLDALVENPPDNVSGKMQAWQVADFRRIFARALGLAVVFPHPPTREQVTDTLARGFDRYADALYRSRRMALPPSAGPAVTLRFEVYASGEYAKMLEQSWGL